MQAERTSHYLDSTNAASTLINCRSGPLPGLNLHRHNNGRLLKYCRSSISRKIMLGGATWGPGSKRCSSVGGNNRSAALGFPDAAVLYTEQVRGEVKNVLRRDLFS